MLRYVFIALAITLVAYFSGCGKKERAYEEPMSIDELSSYATGIGETSPEQQLPLVQEPQATPLVDLPPAGPYKPSDREIQTALKNAGFYTGPVDGKIGPLSRKAIEEFQKANGLQVDGKVGPKTWAVLSRHLASQTGTPQ
jgi:murein L,D-transpeptidase YcbB/YkuD